MIVRYCIMTQQGLLMEKLEVVIHKWIESECSPVTWDKLIEILEGMGYTATVKMIKGQYK